MIEHKFGSNLNEQCDSNVLTFLEMVLPSSAFSVGPSFVSSVVLWLIFVKSFGSSDVLTENREQWLRK